MSVDTKLFVTCGKDKLFEVLEITTKVLNEYSRDKLDAYIKDHTDALNRMHFLRHEEYKDQANRFSNGCSAWFYSPDCIGFNFGCGDENKRSLKVISDCGCDYEEIYIGDKTFLTMGCWGSSVEIINLLGKSLKALGDVYIDENDCDDIGFELLGE